MAAPAEKFFSSAAGSDRKQTDIRQTDDLFRLQTSGQPQNGDQPLPSAVFQFIFQRGVSIIQTDRIPPGAAGQPDLPAVDPKTFPARGSFNKANSCPLVDLVNRFAVLMKNHRKSIE